MTKIWIVLFCRGSKSRTALAIDVSGQVGGQPTLTLGSSRATAPPSNAAGCASAHLEGTLALTGLKAYLVTSEEPLLQSSHLDQPGSNPELHAACILSLVSVTGAGLPLLYPNFNPRREAFQDTQLAPEPKALTHQNLQQEMQLSS